VELNLVDMEDPQELVDRPTLPRTRPSMALPQVGDWSIAPDEIETVAKAL